jgi:hypothetical protein
VGTQVVCRQTQRRIVVRSGRRNHSSCQNSRPTRKEPTGVIPVHRASRCAASKNGAYLRTSQCVTQQTEPQGQGRDLADQPMANPETCAGNSPAYHKSDAARNIGYGHLRRSRVRVIIGVPLGVGVDSGRVHVSRGLYPGPSRTVVLRLADSMRTRSLRASRWLFLVRRC